jgi:hypothetical protein
MGRGYYKQGKQEEVHVQDGSNDGTGIERGICGIHGGTVLPV